MKQNTLEHNYLSELIHHALIEIQWIKIKLVKLLRLSSKKENISNHHANRKQISYNQEYLFTHIQDRILR